MEEEVEPPVSFLCSNCYTPCSGADAHVVPHWTPGQRRILTTYRCSRCWIQAIDETREAARSADPEVVVSFCEFLERQGFTDVDVIRNAPPDQAQGYLLMILDSVEKGTVIFDP